MLAVSVLSHHPRPECHRFAATLKTNAQDPKGQAAPGNPGPLRPRRLFAMSEGNARRLFFEALDLMDASNFADAEQRLRDALTYAPANGSILTNLSVVLRQQDK